MKKLFLFVSLLVLVSLSCQALSLKPKADSAPKTATESAAPNGQPSETEEATVSPKPQNIESIEEKLQELNGEPCADAPDLTCVTIQVPLDHFDSSNKETLDVAFGVAPATGERYGMFIQAFPGGPGGEGISSSYLGFYDSSVLEHYDIVYYDQRGIGLSSPLECPKTYAADFLESMISSDSAGEEGLDTPKEQQEAIDSSRKYAENCVAEMGVDPAKLAFYGTDQVAEDLDTFRDLIGDEKVWIYGVSYGTAVAQTYAAAHPDRVAAMILDGTLDLTLNGVQSSLAQEKGFDKVLTAVLNACDDDENCHADMGGKKALDVYDQLAAQVSKKPIAYEYPLANGKKAKGTFTFNELEFTAAYQMYSLTPRMLFLKALAAANQGNIIPMLRLMYQNADIDPATFEYVGDPTFSDTMFLSVLCTDDAYFTGSQEERVQQTIEAGQASNGTVPRLDGSVYTGLSCAFWPSAPKEEANRKPLILPGVPVLVLNATLDPATPFEEGKAVAERLADGYHIYVEGGVHSIFGYGNACPDQYVTDLLVDGKVPDQREIKCTDWKRTIFSRYSPNLPTSVKDFSDPLEMMEALDEAIFYLPEIYSSSWAEDESVGCDYGGTIVFGPSDVGETYAYNKCELVKGIALSGAGSLDYDEGILTMTVSISGDKKGDLTYTYDYNSGDTSVQGTLDGKSVDLSR
ncbi:MAG: alpha/beta hydrolase [Anaerolineales bacterium]|nr:alpha/beta hydrolase [Anaerolineales bacterium]